MPDILKGYASLATAELQPGKILAALDDIANGKDKSTSIYHYIAKSVAERALWGDYDTPMSGYAKPHYHWLRGDKDAALRLFNDENEAVARQAEADGRTSEFSWDEFGDDAEAAQLYYVDEWYAKQPSELVDDAEAFERAMIAQDTMMVNDVDEMFGPEEFRKPVISPESGAMPSRERQRTAIRERVQEYDPSVTADRHILNIVKKYGGYALTRFDQITTEMVQNAFARRSIERRAAGQASDIDARIVQARVAALEENMTRLELSAPKELTREAWSRDLYDMMPEQADGVIAVTDAIADHWAQENGKTRDAWYNEFLFERGGTEIGGDGLEQGLKGSTRWLDNGKAIIHAFESADVSTIVHEVAHVWMEQLGEADRDIVSRWLKQQGADIADVKGKELFARGFERYLAEGKAPTPKLAQVFANFKRWMLDIYKAITGSDIAVKLNDEVRAMFDKWMGGEVIVGEPFTVRGGTIGNAKGKFAAFDSDNRMMGNWFDTEDAARLDAQRIIEQRQIATKESAAQQVEIERVFRNRVDTKEAAA